MFSGSYDPDDCIFLLKPARVAPTPVAEKERLIQSGRRHYSEMISAESLPSPVYLRVFHDSFARQKERFARDLVSLAGLIDEARPTRVTLVSLARAGTPVGAILKRILKHTLGRDVPHYSVSIIRDRGLDETALRYIVDRHGAESVAFIDGWTGKGVIAGELRKSVASFNETHSMKLDDGLFAVADLSGTAATAATSDDYLIPSSVLGCTISGLVSRSILNSEVVGPGDFHACVFYEEHREQDLSRWFVEEVSREAAASSHGKDVPVGREVTTVRRDELRRRSTEFLQSCKERFRIRDVNHVKPGIGEATRVLLRRVPDRLLLREPGHPDVAHLRLLAEEKKVPIDIDPALPYLAAALIKEIDG